MSEQPSPPPPGPLEALLKAHSQHLYPHHLLSLAMYAVTRCRWRTAKTALIRWFARRYRVDMSDAEEPSLAAYPTFNAFFTRALRNGARPLPADADSVLSPADGVVSQIGAVRDGRILQAKDRTFTVAELLGGDPGDARHFRDGGFATVYLSPRDYHRVHMPLAGRLLRTVYIPGRLFSVNRVTTQVIPRVFARNERVVAWFETEAGPMAVVLVGAIFVGSIETVWAGRITPPYRRTSEIWTPGSQSVEIGRGEELGRFNMGSTVVVLLGQGRARWDEFGPQTQVLVREPIGRLTP